MVHVQTSPVGELGSLHCELTELIHLQSELFMFCLLNTSKTEQYLNDTSVCLEIDYSLVFDASMSLFVQK